MRRWAKPGTATPRLHTNEVADCLSTTKGAPHEGHQRFPNPLCAQASTLCHEVAGWAAEVGYLGSVGRDYGWQWYKEQYEAELVKTYWGTLPELLDGQVSGRAIIVP